MTPAETAARAEAGSAMARWSAKALLITVGVLLVGGAVWYARAATVPLIVAALISTQLLPAIDWATRRGLARGLAIATSLIAVVLIAAGLAWLFTAALFGNLGGAGQDISEGADEAVVWLQEHNAWVREHEDAIRDFLAGVLPAAKAAAGGVLTAVLGGLSFTAQLVSGAALVFVFLLYFLTGGDAIWSWIQERFSPGRRDRVARGGAAAWNAATGYIRGIALVALIDSTVIVLVTLGAVGIGGAVAIAVVILVAQQLDSMFVTPLVYKQTVNLHPIVTLTSVIVGSQLLGIVGAFLAVPMVAVGWAIYNALEQPEPAPATPAGPEPAAAPGVTPIG